MPDPTASDLALNDTPALAVLKAQPYAFPGVDPENLKAAQDLLRVAKRVLETFGGEFARRGLSPGRYSVLMTLYEHGGPLAPSQIADRIGVTRATITGLITGLARDGLVTADPVDMGDRRRKTVRLSKQGRRLMEGLMPSVFSQMCALVAPLSPAERDQLQGLLGRVEARLPALRQTESANLEAPE